ncbi:HspA [Microcystis aeruginosa PCC 7806SL]|uniref:HspA n=1 Tax=Microcystis aeruginosa PCC 7806SL TaxID=1903187 RepID=A0AB33BUL1_MICA7|nr:HspA [Microcystis aeruginosa PCC 7806SL]
MFDRLVPTDVGNGEKMGLSFIPAAEMTETPEAVQLKLEIPGMEAKDLNVEVTADSLTINGERKSEIKTEEEGFTRTEFRYGKFHRVIPLPVQVDNTNVAAEYKDGILNLTLPKAEEEKNKVVKVSISPAIAQ